MKRILLLSFALLFGVAAYPKADGLRVMSFNIHRASPDDTGELSWEARKAPCAKAVKKYKPDLIGLQEAFFEHASHLLKELPKYQIVDRHEKAGDLEPILEANENPILYRADKFELLDYGFFWLNEDQTAMKPGWDAASVRNTTWVKLRIKKSGRIFFFFNTHFDHRGEKAREESARLAVTRIKEIAGDDAVVFLGGDLGMPGGQAGIKPLADYMQEAGTSAKKPDKAPTFNNFGKGSPMWPDHLFFRNATVKSFKVADEPKYGVKYISDHYPIVSDFSIDGKKEKKKK